MPWKGSLSILMSEKGKRARKFEHPLPLFGSNWSKVNVVAVIGHWMSQSQGQSSCWGISILRGAVSPPWLGAVEVLKPG
jgi:hypothetical protein